MRPAFSSSKASWTLGWSESDGFQCDMTSFLLCYVFDAPFFHLNLRQCGVLSHQDRDGRETARGGVAKAGLDRDLFKSIQFFRRPAKALGHAHILEPLHRRGAS